MQHLLHQRRPPPLTERDMALLERMHSQARRGFASVSRLLPWCKKHAFLGGFFRNLINAVHSFCAHPPTHPHTHHPPPSDRSGTRPRATWEIHQNLYLGRPLVTL